MVKRVPNYHLVKLRIPQNFAFPISKHIFDKQVMEKGVFSIKSVNLKYQDKFTPPNASMFARWSRPALQDGVLTGGFFTVTIVACPQCDLTEVRRVLMKTYTPIMLDWMNDESHDEAWEQEKHSFIVTLENDEFSAQVN